MSVNESDTRNADDSRLQNYPQFDMAFLLQYYRNLRRHLYTMNVHFALELLKEKDNGSSFLLNLLVGPIKLFQVWIFYSRTADK
jgi:hypothetical protein